MSIKTRVQLPSGQSFLADLDESLKVTEHFTVRELANPSAPELVKFLITPESLVFMQRIEEFRRWYDLPMTVGGCYRSPVFNRSVGGIANSEHLKALALDWHVSHTETQRNNVKNRIFKQAKSYGCGCHVIYYSWGYHIDFEGNSLMCIDKR